MCVSCNKFLFCSASWLYVLSYLCLFVYIFFILYSISTVNKHTIEQYNTCRAGQATPKVYLPRRQFLLPRTMLNKGGLHCEDSAQNITCRAGQVRGLFCLPDCIFCRIHLQLATGQVVMLHAGVCLPIGV